MHEKGMVALPKPVLGWTFTYYISLPQPIETYSHLPTCAILNKLLLEQLITCYGGFPLRSILNGTLGLQPNLILEETVDMGGTFFDCCREYKTLLRSMTAKGAKLAKVRKHLENAKTAIAKLKAELANAKVKFFPNRKASCRSCLASILGYGIR